MLSTWLQEKWINGELQGPHITQKKELKEAGLVGEPQDGSHDRKKSPMIRIDASDNSNSTGPIKGYPPYPLCCLAPTNNQTLQTLEPASVH